MGLFDYIVIGGLIFLAVGIGIAHNVVPGTAVAGLVGLLLVAVMIYGMAKAIQYSDADIFSKGSKSDRMSTSEVLAKTNEVLKETYDENITLQSDNTEFHSTEYIHPKTHNLIRLRAVSGYTKNSKQKLLVIFSETEKDVTDFILNPTTEQIEHPFDHIDPVTYSTLLRRDSDDSSDNNKGGDDGLITVNYNRRGSNNNNDQNESKSSNRRYRRRGR